MGADLSIWLAWLAGALVAAVMIGFIWWSLFGDRSRGRRRCPRCWHNRTGSPGLRCAECGQETGREEDLFRTRRRWGRALATFAILLAATFYLRLSVSHYGITSMAPNSVLLALLPYSSTAPGAPSDLHREILARLEWTDPDRGLLEALRRRILAGDHAAPPASLPWQYRYGRLANALLRRAAQATDPEDPVLAVVESFREIPPRPVIAAARTVGEEEAILIDFAVAEWWPPATQAEVLITDGSDGRSHRLRLDAGAAQRSHVLEFAPRRDEETNRTFTVSVRVEPIGGPRAGRAEMPPFERDLTLDLNLVTAAPLLEPTDAPDLGDAVAEVFREGVFLWESGARPVAFRIDAGRTGDETFTDILIGVEAALLEEGVVRRRIHVWWPAGPRSGSLRAEVIEEDLAALGRLDLDAEGWTFRVRGLAPIAARAHVPAQGPEASPAPSAIRYWSGERTMPARVILRSGEAPRRRWLLLPE